MNLCHLAFFKGGIAECYSDWQIGLCASREQTDYQSRHDDIYVFHIFGWEIVFCLTFKVSRDHMIVGSTALLGSVF
jgi:hypothetical protein